MVHIKELRANLRDVPSGTVAVESRTAAMDENERQPLRYELRDRTAWLTIDRPEVRNALNPSVVDGLAKSLERAAADHARAIVVTGSGSAFCAGADLRFVQERLCADGDLGAFLGDVGAVLHRLAEFPAPTVAAVNGVAVAGGLELLLACDLVVAADCAMIGDGHANYGLIPGAGTTVRLPRAIGPSRAKYLMFTGAVVPADQLVATGLVNEVVPADELQHRVEAICESIATKSPGGLAHMKRLSDRALDMDAAAADRMEQEALRVHLRSEDVSEGLRAFREGRKPGFAEANPFF